MEDAHTTVLDLLAGASEQERKAHASKLSFFGVYDGHGGDKVALFTGENIHRIIAKQDAFKVANYEQALKDGFLATDRAILNGIYTDIYPSSHGAISFPCRPPSTPARGFSGVPAQRISGPPSRAYELKSNDRVNECRPQVRRGGFWLHSLCRVDHRRQDLRCQSHTSGTR